MCKLNNTIVIQVCNRVDQINLPNNKNNRNKQSEIHQTQTNPNKQKAMKN